MSDDMIFQLAKNGGVIQINFGSMFLKSEFQKKGDESRTAINKYFEEHQLKPTDSVAIEYAKQYRLDHPTGYADVKDVVDHIDHVAQLVGVEYVGLGSDFDGVGDSLPTGLKDVSYYPNLKSIDRDFFVIHLYEQQMDALIILLMMHHLHI